MKQTRAHKLRVSPREGKQIKRMHQFAGAARYAYNWLLRQTLDEREAVKAAREAMSAQDRERFNALNALRGKARKDARDRGDFAEFAAYEWPSTNWQRLYKMICDHRGPKDRSGDAPWLWDVHSHVYSNAAKALDNAYDRWLKSGAGKLHHPRFHKRKTHQSFTIQIHRRDVRRRSVRVPGIGWMRVDVEKIGDVMPAAAKVHYVTCSTKAGRWYASVTYSVEIDDPLPRVGPVIGIDLGINASATIARSDRPGVVERVAPPRPMREALAWVAELDRRLSFGTDFLKCVDCGVQGWGVPINASKAVKRRRPRKCPACAGRLRPHRSNRARALELRLQRAHERVANIRADHLHKLSERLTSTEYGAATIVTEGHNVRDLVTDGVGRTTSGKKKRNVRRAMLDIGWGEFRRQLGYKSAWRGVTYLQAEGIASHQHGGVAVVATDQECHVCGTRNPMPRDTNEYNCDACGLETTRQENTAWLLVQYGAGGVPGATRAAGGDPAAGRGDGTAGERRGNTRLPDGRGLGANGCMTTLPGEGSNPPRGSRKRKKARKAGGKPRRKARAKKAQGGVG